MPNFFVIGAPRSGTTSLYHYLRQHPQVFMSSVKEPRFFLFEGGVPTLDDGTFQTLRRESVPDIVAYRQLFQNVRDEIAIGEATTTYLRTPGCAARIAHHVPEAKLIAILRHPVDRAHSAWSKQVREGMETSPFEEALAGGDENGARGRQRFWYRQTGFYHQHLMPYFESFDRSQIRVILYEDLRDVASLFRPLCRFLGVDDTFAADFSIRHNASGQPRHFGIQRLLSGRHPVKDLLKRLVPERWGHRAIEWASSRNLQRLALSPQTHRHLCEAYRGDIGRLEHLINRDLSHWLSDAVPKAPNLDPSAPEPPRIGTLPVSDLAPPKEDSLMTRDRQVAAAAQLADWPSESGPSAS